MTHHCHANHCPVPTARGLFMCARHWYMVPPGMRARVWKEYRNAGGSGGPIKNTRHAAYFEACANAVEFVATKEGKPTANSYRRTVDLLRQIEK